ncbi:MAG TPA: DUF3422 family protein, partial [Candidatus Omnitrophota bacterium]|nr:DUF3422 family protein [Candidatus Omnitrophota bacterium]
MTETIAITMPTMREHELRRSLAGEVHARPYEQLTAPMRASHLAVLHDGADAAGERAFVAELLVQHGGEAPGEGANYVSRDLGGLRLRWERHSEFSTYTFFRTDAFDQPFAAAALDLVGQDWLRRMPGEVMTAVHVALEAAERAADDLSAQFDGN